MPKWIIKQKSGIPAQMLYTTLPGNFYAGYKHHTICYGFQTQCRAVVPEGFDWVA
jgi:hypothetical protein